MPLIKILDEGRTAMLNGYLHLMEKIEFQIPSD